MNIALFGATGMIGSRILDEALRRGHQVSALVRDVSKLKQTDPNVSAVSTDILDAERVAEAVAGHDVAVSAYGPGFAPESVATLLPATRALIAGVEKAGVARLIAIGGAGGLEVAPNVPLIDAASFPDAWRPIAQAHIDALEIYRHDAGGLDWTNISPSAMIEPGERTENFRLGGDTLLTDAQGNSRISAEDFAIAVLDEVERPAHIRQRFTVGY